MKKPFYNIVSNKGETSARIDIYGIIAQDYWGDGETIEAKKFVSDFANLEKNFDRIDIHINSPGGSIHEGLPIFNAIRASKKDVHTYNDGIAYSMAFMILIAGHTVHAAKGSLLMAHNASSYAWGNAKALRKSADDLETYDVVMAELIADKTGLSVEEVKEKWLNMEDNFMTASQAKESKLIDILETYDVQNVPENVENLSYQQVTAHYRDQSQEPSASFLDKVFNGIKAKFPTNQITEMKFPKIVALAGIENPTSEQLDLANADLSTAGVTNLTLVTESMLTEAQNATAQNETLTSDLATANGKVTDLETQVTALKEQIAKGPGAIHTGSAGADEPTVIADESADAIAELPHNKAAAALLN